MLKSNKSSYIKKSLQVGIFHICHKINYLTNSKLLFTKAVKSSPFNKF